ncbi:MAG TPA: PAS domain-containing protein [Actinomycetota bacterium]
MDSGLQEKGEAEIVVDGASPQGTFRVLVEHIPAVVNISGLDEVSSTLYISPQVETLLGYPKEQWMDDPALWIRVLHPDDRDRIIALHLDHLARGGTWAEEYRLIARDGRVVWIREHAAIVANDAGEPMFEQGVWLDVTDRKQAEQDLVRSYRALQKTDKERKRLLASLVTAQEQERRRIASDIHDDALQHLATMILQVELAGRESGSLSGEALAELKSNLKVAVDSLRRVLFETRPPVLDEGGLAAAIRTYLAHVTRDSSLKYDVTSGLSGEPEAEIRTVAYRIVQEAITNVRKHARATRVDIRIAEHKGGMQVCIQDDGRGFSSEDVAQAGPTHVGLVTMRERAELAGGWFEVDSTPGTGTSLSFWLPLSDGIVDISKSSEQPKRRIGAIS